MMPAFNLDDSFVKSVFAKETHEKLNKNKQSNNDILNLILKNNFSTDNSIQGFAF